MPQRPALLGCRPERAWLCCRHAAMRPADPSQCRGSCGKFGCAVHDHAVPATVGLAAVTVSNLAACSTQYQAAVAWGAEPSVKVARDLGDRERHGNDRRNVPPDPGRGGLPALARRCGPRRLFRRGTGGVHGGSSGHRRGRRARPNEVSIELHGRSPWVVPRTQANPGGVGGAVRRVYRWVARRRGARPFANRGPVGPSCCRHAAGRYRRGSSCRIAPLTRVYITGLSVRQARMPDPARGPAWVTASRDLFA